MGIIKQIFKDNWSEFKKNNKGRIIQTVLEDIERMINCGDITKGYIEHECLICGENVKVGFTCKCRFCNTCGKVYVDQRADKMAEKLVRSMHRHMVFTVPSEMRNIFLKDRSLLKLIPQCSAEAIKSWMREKYKEEYMPGIIAVIHTFGRDLKWNPHAHLLVTEGGVGKTKIWKEIDYFSYISLKKRYQKLILDELEKAIGKNKFRKLKNQMYKNNKEGFYVYGEGKVRNSKQAPQYVGRYTGRPAIAESRILEYNKEAKTVTFWYERHEDKKRVEETLSVEEFIGKLIRHIPERDFKMIRYYGIYARRAKKKIEKLLKMVNEKVAEIKRKMNNWRYRMILNFGIDPIKCKNCGTEMYVKDICYPRIGSVLANIEARMKKEYENELKHIENINELIKKENGYGAVFV